MINGFGFAIETLVAVLLAITIGYCILLNMRLKRFKADELTLKATISELITATEIAERAIAGLKLTVRDCDKTLGERLRTAERFCADITQQVAAGEEIVSKLGQIAMAARSGRVEPDTANAANEPARAEPYANATVIAAQALAARTRQRLSGVAA